MCALLSLLTYLTSANLLRVRSQRSEKTEEENKGGEQALDHERLLSSLITEYTPATSQPGSLPGVLPSLRR